MLVVLVLCRSGILGKGTLRTYPWGRVPTQVAIFLAVLVVVGLRDGEYSAELVFELVDGLRRDHAVEACQFVVEVD